MAVQKLPGVETVNVSLEHASVDVRLREGNTITLPQLRSLIKNNGFTAKEATITAVGRIVERNGSPAFEIGGIDTTISLTADPQSPAALEQAREQMRRKDTADTRVVGTVKSGAQGGQERLELTSIEKYNR